MNGSDYYRHKSRLLRTPGRWSVRTRRLFLLTLPVASLAWLLLVIGYGFLGEMAAIADVLGSFWNGRNAPRTVYDLGAYKPRDAAGAPSFA